MATKQGFGNTSALSTLSVIVAGKNTFGKTGDIKVPDWEYEIVDEESTGLPKPAKMSLTIFDLNKTIIKAIKDGETIALKGNVRDEGEDKSILITFSMQLHKMSNEFKVGENVGRTFEGRIDVYEETYNNEQTVYYNRETLTLILSGDGVNLLETIAKNTL